MITETPKKSEVEITLIGTGGGYGESIIIKIGIDSWIIIDSCINPNNKKPLPLEYLYQIGVDPSKVFLVICTHWHNDHILGLANVLSQCVNAEFCFSAVSDLKKFLYLCELDHTKSKKGSLSSTNEFAECLALINKRGTYFTRAQSDLTLAKLKENETEFVLYALSPSPKIINNFDSEISQLITEFGSRNTAIINKSPNEKSVALLLKFGENRVLLGSDLEIGKSDNEGWHHVIKYSKVVDNNKANLFKIPHHGSENGYLEDIFNTLVNENSILKLTPFRSNGLPTDEMLEVYSKHSNQIFMTSQNISSKKPKKRENPVEKMISNFVVNISEIKYSHGIVRSRINYLSKSSDWETNVYEGGLKLQRNQQY